MKYLKVLYVQVIIGITAGIVTGWFFPSFAPTAKLISEGFINMIKMVITPVIFLTVVLFMIHASVCLNCGLNVFVLVTFRLK